MSYTALSLIAVAAALVMDVLLLRTRLVRRRAFWTAYAIVLGFQFVVNGILTGIPIVSYDRAAITGVRIFFAPIEDLLFGFVMTLFTLAMWVWLGRRANSGGPESTRRARATRRS